MQTRQRRQRVNQHVRHVMISGIQTEQLNVQNVRETGQREPVRGFGGGERPTKRLAGEALADMRIRSHVIGIVKINEVEGPDFAICGNGGEEKSCVYPRSGDLLQAEQ